MSQRIECPICHETFDTWADLELHVPCPDERMENDDEEE